MNSVYGSFPKISIMIPTFNQETYIEDAIASALGQTYPNIEVIVADDASTDRTQSIVHRFKDARLIYIKNKVNLGRVSNYHKTLYDYSRGDWAVNLDGDDYFTDQLFIEKAVSYINNSSDIIMVGAGCKSCNGDRDKLFIPTNKSKIVDGLEVFKKWDSIRLTHLSIVYSRHLAIRIGFYQKNVMSTDWESFLRLILHGKVALLTDIVGVWRKHQQNETLDLDFDKFTSNTVSITSPAEYALSIGIAASVIEPWMNRLMGNHALNYLAKNVSSMREAPYSGRVRYRENIEKLIQYCRDEKILPFKSPIQQLAWKTYSSFGPNAFLHFTEMGSNLARYFSR